MSSRSCLFCLSRLEYHLSSVFNILSVLSSIHFCLLFLGSRIFCLLFILYFVFHMFLLSVSFKLLSHIFCLFCLQCNVVFCFLLFRSFVHFVSSDLFLFQFFISILSSVLPQSISIFCLSYRSFLLQSFTSSVYCGILHLSYISSSVFHQISLRFIISKILSNTCPSSIFNLQSSLHPLHRPTLLPIITSVQGHDLVVKEENHSHQREYTHYE